MYRVQRAGVPGCYCEPQSLLVPKPSAGSTSSDSLPAGNTPTTYMLPEALETEYDDINKVQNIV